MRLGVSGNAAVAGRDKSRDFLRRRFSGRAGHRPKTHSAAVAPRRDPTTTDAARDLYPEQQHLRPAFPGHVIGGKKGNEEGERRGGKEEGREKERERRGERRRGTRTREKGAWTDEPLSAERGPHRGGEHGPALESVGEATSTHPTTHSLTVRRQPRPSTGEAEDPFAPDSPLTVRAQPTVCMGAAH